MNPFFQFIISKKVRQIIKERGYSAQSDYSFDDIFRDTVIEYIHKIKEYLFIMLGVASAGFGLSSFLLPNGFIDGGVTGISLLTSEVSGVGLSVLLIVINLPFLIMGYSQIGQSFVIKSLLAIIGLALAVHFVPYPPITNDKLLVAAFGGFFLGAGIGLAIRGGAVLDGTEILAIFLSKRLRLTVGDIILIFNIMIFSVGAYILSIEIALYAILTYMAASKTVDFVIEGIEEYTGISIISHQTEEVRKMLTNTLGHGVTIYHGSRGFTPEGERTAKQDILYTVVTRLEIAKLQTELDKIDPHAFVIMNSIRDTKGGMIKKRAVQKLKKK
jgi:uncharacterized membrane-anchored protein YitT (DUF2179 family)